MIELNTIPVTTTTDITLDVEETLKKHGVNVIIVPVPAFYIETEASGFTFEILTRMANDINYACSKIIEKNPEVVFLREVVRIDKDNEPTTYKFRYNYLKAQL